MGILQPKVEQADAVCGSAKGTCVSISDDADRAIGHDALQALGGGRVPEPAVEYGPKRIRKAGIVHERLAP